MKITKNIKILFLYTFLVDFLVAIQIAIIPKFSKSSISIGNYKAESFVLAFILSFFIFIFFLDVFKNKQGLKRTIQAGLAFMIFGSIAIFVEDSEVNFIFGRIFIGLGSGMVIASQLGMIWHGYFEKIRLFWVVILGAFCLGFFGGDYFLDFLSGPNLSDMRVAFILSSIIPALAIFEFNKYSESGIRFLLREKARIGILGVGHFMNETFNFFFDYILYSFVIWKFGPLWGSLIMGCLALATCYIMIRMYDWSKKDWLGLETIKQLKQFEGGSFFRRMISRILKKGDWAIFIFLSIQFDAFVTMIYMREGAHKYSGFSKRDWKIFFSSFLVSFIYWNSIIITGVSIFKYLFF